MQYDFIDLNQIIFQYLLDILGTILGTHNTFCFLVCPKGYFGETCDKPCRFPSFGDDCQSKCSCNVDYCNHIMNK